MKKINQYRTIKKSDELLYFSYLKKYSNLIHINHKEFLSVDEIIKLWSLIPGYIENDIKGRMATLRVFTDRKIIDDIKKKLLDFYLEQFPMPILIDNVNICHIPNPTRPHIDGHYPFYPNDDRQYCVTKICIIPIAFDTEEKSTEQLTTDFITFKEHYNYRYGGYEFQEDFNYTTNYKHFNFFDFDFNIISRNPNRWIDDKNDWGHILAIPGMEKSLHIDRVYKMSLGDLVTINPYQIHCTGAYQGFTSKYVLRFLICCKLYE